MRRRRRGRKELGMRSRLAWSGISAAIGTALVCVGAVPLAGQTATGPGAASKAAASGTWTAPRTPWGDPDLQGNYTNTYEQGTPLERPNEFAGRRLEDVKGDELAKVRRQ